MQQTTIWNSRWQALTTLLDEMEKTYNTLANPTFAAATVSLKAFGADQFEFFLTGFNDNRLQFSHDFPPENILRAILDQVSYDITAVQQAVAQRQDSFPAMKEALTTADALTQSALNLGSASKLIKPAVPLPYFIKAPNIRVIPYASAAIVGIPYSCLETVRDYLATPHEVGHYNYHHGAGIAADLHKLLPGMPAWGAGWLEEIFADVYGCLVAGPVMALDFQDLLADNTWHNFVSSDGDHPVDAIRPFCYTKVLQEIGCVNAAEALNKRWHEILLKRGNPQNFYLANGDEIAMAAAKQFVQETAVVILGYLKKRGVPTNQTWTEDLPSAGTSPLHLYQSFANKLNKLKQTPCNTLQINTNENKAFVQLPDGTKQNQRTLGNTQSWIDWAKKQNRLHNNEPLPTAIWRGIFNAGGWPVKGPEDPGGG